MSKLLPILDIAANTWTDVYNATGVSPGKKLIIQVVFSREDVMFSDTAAKPTETDGFNRCELKQFFQNDSGDAGCWAFSAGGARLAIKEG